MEKASIPVNWKSNEPAAEWLSFVVVFVLFLDSME